MKALVVAGGLPQITLINELKERGVETVLVDGSATPIAKDYADKFYQINIFDVDAVKAIAQTEKVDFAITVCADQVLLVVAQISEELGLPWYIDYSTAKKVSDKELMKRIFMENDIPTSRYIVLDEFDLKKAEHLTYPLIVKPVDAYSSKGVKKVKDESELKTAFDEAKAISRSKKVIIEEFFDGEEISVDLFIEDGKAHVLCISNSEKIEDDNHFVIFRGKYPVHASKKLMREIADVSQKIADAFGLKNAPMLVQMLTDGCKVSVLEFCARTGGAMKWLLIQHASGVDVINGVIDLAMGIKPDIQVKPPETKYIVNEFIYCKAGIYDHIEGFDEQLKKGNITDYRIIRPYGWQFSGMITSSTDRLCGVTFQANTISELNRKHDEFIGATKVVDLFGNDIMRHDLLREFTD